MFQHYPEYSGAPYDMMDWLKNQALAHEQLYAPPDRPKKPVKNPNEPDEPIVLDPSPSHGVGETTLA